MTADATFPPDERASWVAVRRYAVPAWMIERAAERREAGDWRGACEAANVDVEFDLDAVAAEHGDPVARAFEADLLALAPDLLRWHLPRILHGHSVLSTDRTVMLSGTGPYLVVETRPVVSGTQRLRLRVSPDRVTETDWSDARHLWSASDSVGLRDRIGGTPFFRQDGTPGASGGLAEQVALAMAEGRSEDAYALAGITLDLTPDSDRYARPLPEILEGVPLNLTVLADELRRNGEKSTCLPLHWATAAEMALDGDGLRIVARARHGKRLERTLAEARYRRLPDLDLLRQGAITIPELHPLVVASLFPAYDGPVTGPPGPAVPGPVRVRCNGVWHEMRGGVATAHSPQERRREHALKALGGKVSGCFAVEEAWRGDGDRLPKGLRAQRLELFSRAQHGDEPGVLALLEAGCDPKARDGRERTLLHYLPCLDHTRLLPLLLAAGLDLEAVDQGGRSPLHFAVGHSGSESLVRALVEAGSQITCVDESGWSLRHLVRHMRRYELRFLYDQVPPDTGEEWHDETYDDDDEDYDWGDEDDEEGS